MKTRLLLAILLATLTFLSFPVRTLADTFGSGANSFEIEFVTIGNPGNAATLLNNPTAFGPFGAVSDTYRIGKFEISESSIDIANAWGGLEISQDTRGPHKPATSVNWLEAARFVNWLNTSAGSPPAYKFAVQPGESGYSAQASLLYWEESDLGHNPENVVRNSLARYFLPSADEWFKAAYYDPISESYFHYPTGGDSPPTAVASGTIPGTAVFNGQSGPADVNMAGGMSSYGTMAQGGNVEELLEFTTSIGFRYRGGAWSNSVGMLGPSIQSFYNGILEIPTVGFRVASLAIPEPNVLVLGALAGFGFFCRRESI